MSTTPILNAALAPVLDDAIRSWVVSWHHPHASEAERAGLRPSTERNEAVLRVRMTHPKAMPVR
jgi:hypothetical protein